MILFESIVFRCFFLVVQIWSLFTFSFWFCLVLELNVADNVWSMVLMHLNEKKIRFWTVDRLEENNLLICFNSQYRNFTRIFFKISVLLLDLWWENHVQPNNQLIDWIEFEIQLKNVESLDSELEENDGNSRARWRISICFCLINIWIELERSWVSPWNKE